MAYPLETARSHPGIVQEAQQTITGEYNGFQ